MYLYIQRQFKDRRITYFRTIFFGKPCTGFAFYNIFGNNDKSEQVTIQAPFLMLYLVI